MSDLPIKKTTYILGTYQYSNSDVNLLTNKKYDDLDQAIYQANIWFRSLMNTCLINSSTVIYDIFVIKDDSISNEYKTLDSDELYNGSLYKASFILD